MTICIYEDQSWRNFVPLTYTRPVYALRPGVLSLYEKLVGVFSAKAVSLASRTQLAPVVAKIYKDRAVNIIKRADGDVVFVNGRIRRLGNLIDVVKGSRFSIIIQSKSGELVAVLFKKCDLDPVPHIATPADYLAHFKKLVKEIPPSETSAELYQRIWDFVGDISAAVSSDFDYLRHTLRDPQNVKVANGSYFINEHDIYLGDAVEIAPTVVLDASSGPVFIGAHTKVEPHAIIVGPSFIGANSVVLPGRIVGSSIGHTSRVGGEIEASIFQAYVNKYHAGFIGHSYVGEWVNFGAMTTNSDLKNNYSNVRVSQFDKDHDTGSIKIGSFIGDHTKFGIGTLLTTGINIGVSCNIFGGGLVTEKEIPSFRWGTSGKFETYQFEKAIETARKSTSRRHHEMSSAEESLLQDVSDGKQNDDGVLAFLHSESAAIQTQLGSSH